MSIGLVSQLRRLWRSEIQLWKVFWLFGVVAVFLFSFIFIKAQESITVILRKALKGPLYLDCFLVLLFVIYGIFTIVAVWRSANKYQGQKIWSHISKLISILVMLWFSANIGLYLVVKITYPPALEALADYVPEELNLPEVEFEADSLYFGDFRLRFPFYREDIRSVSPLFMEHRPENIGIFLSNAKGMINVAEIPDNVPKVNPFFISRIENWLVDEREFGSYFKTMGQLHYARLKDYSWWNIRSNVRLAVKLVLKAISIPAFGDSKVYEVETPHLKGYLRKGQYVKNKSKMILFEFAVKGKSYSVMTVTTDDNAASRVMDMISTIQPSTDIDRDYAEMETQYKHKDKTRYPEELLLLSLISLKGLTIDNMSALLKIEESKKKNQFAIDNIKGELDFLRHSQLKNN